MDIDNLEEITPEDSVVPVYLEPLTEEEIAKRKLEYEKFLQAEQQEKDQQIKKEQDVQAAIAKLAKLGLTEDEAKAIAGL